MPDLDCIWYRICIVFDTGFGLYLIPDLDSIWYRICIVFDTGFGLYLITDLDSIWYRIWILFGLYLIPDLDSIWYRIWILFDIGFALCLIPDLDSMREGLQILFDSRFILNGKRRSQSLFDSVKSHRWFRDRMILNSENLQTTWIRTTDWSAIPTRDLWMIASLMQLEI